MAAQKIPFYFDYLSPYAYLMWKQLPGLAHRNEVEFLPIPIVFGALLRHWGHLGPAEIPPKRMYVIKDVMRRAAQQRVPIGVPQAHPFNPLPALRATLAVDNIYQSATIDRLFDCAWGGTEPRRIDTPESVCGVLEQVGVPIAVASLSEDIVKQALRAHTEQAIGAGVFGVPTLEVNGTLFWGTDSVEFFEEYLKGNDSIDSAFLEQWRNLPTAQTRRR